MTTAVITSKGQITIPKEVRTKLGLEAGDRVEFIETAEHRYLLVPATRDVRQLKSIIPKPGQPVSVEDMNAAIAKMGKRP